MTNDLAFELGKGFVVAVLGTSAFTLIWWMVLACVTWTRHEVFDIWSTWIREYDRRQERDMTATLDESRRLTRRRRVIAEEAAAESKRRATVFEQRIEDLTEELEEYARTESTTLWEYPDYTPSWAQDELAPGNWSIWVGNA